MKYSEILEKHIYIVDFNPVRDNEFDRKHLAVVLKKNPDRKTAIVAPLTTSSKGDGVTKLNLGKISTLPENLKEDKSYVVFNQVRTVNVTRFEPLYNNNNIIKCPLNDDLFDIVINSCSDVLLTQSSLENRRDYFKTKYIENTMSLVLNAAYSIKRLLTGNNKNEILELQNQIKDLLDLNFEYVAYIKDIDKENKIDIIIESCLNDTILKSLEIQEEVASSK